MSLSLVKQHQSEQQEAAAIAMAARPQKLKAPAAAAAAAATRRQSIDDLKLVRLELLKPLGLTLAENVPDEPRGVYVDDLSSSGSAAGCGQVRVGMLLLAACGVDVRRKDFDAVMDILRDAPPNKPLLLVFDDRIPSAVTTTAAAAAAVNTPLIHQAEIPSK